MQNDLPATLNPNIAMRPIKDTFVGRAKNSCISPRMTTKWGWVSGVAGSIQFTMLVMKLSRWKQMGEKERFLTLFEHLYQYLSAVQCILYDMLKCFWGSMRPHDLHSTWEGLNSYQSMKRGLRRGLRFKIIKIEYVAFPIYLILCRII